MKRKVTGWFLFLLMTVFTVTAHSSLRYCLCNHEVSLGECFCEQANASPLEGSKSDAVPCCNSCEQQESYSHSISLDQEISGNCDFTVDIIVQLDDFVLTIGNQFNPRSDSNLYQPLFNSHKEVAIPATALMCNDCSPRGSPPIVNRLDVPIYLRDSVYRL